MTKTEKTYKTVAAAVAKDPKLNVSKFCKAQKLSANMYYKYKRQLGKPSKRRGRKTKLPVVKYQKIRAVSREPLPATGGDKMIFVMGSADQIRDVMGALQ